MDLYERSCTDADTEPFRLRTYHKGELARMYFPQSRRKTALQNLSRWIQGCPELWDGLRRMGYEKTRKYYLKTEVELIVKCLGEP